MIIVIKGINNINKKNLLLLDLSSFIIIGKFNIKSKYWNPITILKINKKELLLTIYNEIYILNLDNLKIKLKITYEQSINHSFLLKDKTIILCDEICAKRYNQKNFELISYFYNCKTNNLEGYIFHIYIINSLVISDKKMIFGLYNGEYELNSTNF